MQEAEWAENWFCLEGQHIWGSGQRWEVSLAVVLGELLGSSPPSAAGSSASWQLCELPTASHQPPLRWFRPETVPDAGN